MRVSAWTRPVFWPIVFFALVLFYAVYYAPYGINETDGGFLTGLAWQVVQGKTLYQDIVYVRPPLPVWLRAVELQILPPSWPILGERWIFYVKVAVYSWLAAAVLAAGRDRWRLTVFGFVVSAHCYPATAWHTVDGILCAVLSAYALFKMPGRGGAILAGVALFAALLCKQSFYPLAVFGLAAAYLHKPTRFTWLLAGFLLSTALFFSYLYQNNLVTGFLRMTNGAASGGQGLQHGVLDFFRIAPPLLGFSILSLGAAAWFWKKQQLKIVYVIWSIWLAALIVSYAFAIWQRQDFTVPFAQSRLLFWLAFGLICYKIVHSSPAYALRAMAGKYFILHIPALFLLSISWCAAVSWGYNLPILFATPGVWAALEIGRRIFQTRRGNNWNADDADDADLHGLKENLRKSAQSASSAFQLTLRGKYVLIERFVNLLALAALLIVFRFGYEFVYRDGRRSEMTEDLGHVFPALGGIYSNAETATLYSELKMLSERYGPNFKTLPSFPQANFLTNTLPPLPLDWVVAREMNGDSALISKALQKNKPVLLIEKQYLAAIETDSQFLLVRSVIYSAARLEETSYFLIMQ